MTDTTTSAAGRSPAKKSSFNLMHLLLEGRAFFALIVIIVTFSLLSPNYATVSNFLIMANHVAIFGLLALVFLADLAGLALLAGLVLRARREGWA